MDAVELLQQIGLNKYEAAAYRALLAEGPLTGYELGKRSAVPLSRSYEIAERLVGRGLALLQPGDPPRYLAADPVAFLDGVRAAQAATLAALTQALTALPPPATAGEFWVLRGAAAILDRVRALLDGAVEVVALALPAEHEPAVAAALAAARARGCRVVRMDAPGPALVLLLVDGREALAGALAPAERCQAVVGRHPALAAALGGFFARPAAVPAEPSPMPAAQPSPLDRVAWEDRKQRRLWRLGA
jgi:sugar-specific transcriptional regulator TrmB